MNGSEKGAVIGWYETALVFLEGAVVEKGVVGGVAVIIVVVVGEEGVIVVLLVDLLDGWDGSLDPFLSDGFDGMEMGNFYVFKIVFICLFILYLVVLWEDVVGVWFFWEELALYDIFVFVEELVVGGGVIVEGILVVEI